ncbi:MAG: glycosyltransferase [Panacagrimonas sp.]
MGMGMGMGMGVSGKRLRLLCVSTYPVAGPSVRHRIWGYREHWAQAGIDLTFWSFMDPLFYRVRRRFGLMWSLAKLALFGLATLRLMLRIPFAWRYDAVIIHRELFPLGPPWFELWLARVQPNLYFDLDDAIWAPPSNDINQRALLWDPRRVAKTMAASRHVVVGNAYLETYARQHSRRTHIVPTSCPSNGAVRSGRADGIPSIVWIGNLGNAFYLRELIPVLDRLAARRRFVLRLIGGADLDEVQSTRFEIERLAWREDMENQWLRDADIGVMPLPDLAYEQGKCAFKLIQYFAASLPVVASPVGMNRDVVETGRNGFLADTAEEWESACDTLLADPQRRRAMGEAGFQTYQASFTRQRCAAMWVSLLRPS